MPQLSRYGKATPSITNVEAGAGPSRRARPQALARSRRGPDRRRRRRSLATAIEARRAVLAGKPVPTPNLARRGSLGFPEAPDAGRGVRTRPPALSRSQRQGQDHALGQMPEPRRTERGRAYGVVTAKASRCSKRSSGFSTTIVAGSASRATRRSRQQPIAPARPSPRRCRRWRTRGSLMGSADQARPRTLS